MTRIKLAYIHQYKDRHGVTRRYLRIPGHSGVPLPGLPGSAEFMDAYRAGLSNAPPSRGSKRADGSLGRLIERFYSSTEFANLKPSSKKVYRIALEAVASKDGHRMVHDLPQEKARKVIEEIGSDRPGMANLTRSVMLRLFAYAVAINMRRDNPFLAVPTYKLGTHHTWTEAELDQFENHWPRGTRQRLAYDTLLYTTQRLGDVVGLRRPMSGSEVFRFAQEKTETDMVIGIHAELWRTIEATPAKGIYLLGDPAGRPLTANALGKMMASAIEDAGLPPECVAHGLRKAGMRRLAESGSTAHEIGAVSGHRSLKEIERYTAKVDQQRLAQSAIARLPNKDRAK